MVKTGKAWEKSSCEQYQVDIRGAGPTTNKFEHGWAELSTVSSVSSSDQALKRNQQDDELLIKDTTLRQPDIIHVMNSSRPSPFFAALPLPCIIVNVN